MAASGCSERIGEATSDGLRVFRHETATGGGTDALVQGELRYDEASDCFLLEADGRFYPVVWPVGSDGWVEGPGVELADGTTVQVGQQVSGGGGYYQASDYLDQVTIPPECTPPSGEVAVYNSTETLTVRG